MIKFKTKEGAKQAAKNMDQSFNCTFFCPMINSGCRDDCICFVHAQAYEMDCADTKYDDNKPFTVSHPRCNNNALGGHLAFFPITK